MEKNQIRRSYKKVIIVLLALLLLSSTALGARLFYLKSVADQGGTVVVPDNAITEEPALPPKSVEPTAAASADEAPPATPAPAAGNTAAPAAVNGNISRSDRKKAAISLYQGQATDNARFDVKNMLPGDAVTQEFSVQVSHKRSTTVFFRAKVTEQTKSLADILHIKVTHVETDKVLYDGPFVAMDEDGYAETFAYTGKRETVGHYRIDVSLPTSAGNEYQGAVLKADFDWFVPRDSASGDGSNDDNGTGGTSTLVPPSTGDTFSLTLYAAMAVAAAGLLVLLFRRRKEAAHE